MLKEIEQEVNRQKKMRKSKLRTEICNQKVNKCRNSQNRKKTEKEEKKKTE